MKLGYEIMDREQLARNPCVWIYIYTTNTYCLSRTRIHSYLCVIAIATGALIMVPMLKLTDSCVVYTFVHVCNRDCYWYNHDVISAKVSRIMCRVCIRTCM